MVVLDMLGHEQSVDIVMSMFELEDAPSQPPRTAVSVPQLDLVLTAQLVVAWAGEASEEGRLGWWRSNLVSEYGGQDLFRRLLPNTSEWAVLQAAREAARRADAELRAKDHDRDRIVSLYRFGFDLDERIEERLQDLKRSGQSPGDALTRLSEGIAVSWNRDRFVDWVKAHGDVATIASPVGRRIKGDAPTNLEELVRPLVGALLPLAETYPLPHFRNAQ